VLLKERTQSKAEAMAKEKAKTAVEGVKPALEKSPSTEEKTSDTSSSSSSVPSPTATFSSITDRESVIAYILNQVNQAYSDKDLVDETSNNNNINDHNNASSYSPTKDKDDSPKSILDGPAMSIASFVEQLKITTSLDMAAPAPDGTHNDDKPKDIDDVKSVSPASKSDINGANQSVASSVAQPKLRNSSVAARKMDASYRLSVLENTEVECLEKSDEFMWHQLRIGAISCGPIRSGPVTVVL